MTGTETTTTILWGYVSLKIACTVMTWIRMIMALCFVVELIFLGIEGTVPDEKLNMVYRIGLGIAIVVAFSNFFYSVLCIKGDVSDYAARMNTYINLQTASVVVLLLTFNWYLYILVAIECLFVVCTVKMYRECNDSSQEHALIRTFNTLMKFRNGSDDIPNDRTGIAEGAERENGINLQNEGNESRVIEIDKLSSQLPVMKNGSENYMQPPDYATENSENPFYRYN